VRSYDLSLTSPSGQLLAFGPSGFSPSTTGRATFSSRVPNPNGPGTINNPGALNLEFDAPVAPFATPQGLQSVRLWGIGIQQIAQSADLNPNFAARTLGAGFTLVAGMAPWIAPGNPLASQQAAYAGVLMRGTVFQAFGNWQGVNQTLELVIQPTVLSPAGGIAFGWQPGQTLAAAIQASLLAAYPGYLVQTNIRAPIVQAQLSEVVGGYYYSISDFAAMILAQSQAIGAQVTGNAHYPGVSIVARGNTLYAYDYSATTKATQLKLQDFIGQPTWVNASTVNFKTVLRADLQVGDQVTFPTEVVSPYALTAAAAAVPGSPARNSSTFKGTFPVTEVHHFGNFRQPDADSWATAFSAVPTGVSA